MKRRPTIGPRAGFTLIEVLVVLTILFIMALVGFPIIQQLILRNKLMGVTRELTHALHLARHTAVRTGRPVVAEADYAEDTLVVFVNVDDDANLRYEPDLAKPPKTTDYTIARVPLPAAQSASASVYFWGPADASAEGADAVVGFTPADGGRPSAAVFERDGSIRDVGAFRIADTRGNFFELRIEPQATAQVEVLKYYNDNPPWGGSPDYFPQGQHPAGFPLWMWRY